MNNNKQQKETHLILGLGKSGLSCARYFDRIGQSYCLLDTRNNPPGLDQIEDLTHCRATIFGKLECSLLDHCKILVVSPGVALSEPFVREATKRELDVCGDIELFARGCDKPIVAITGSNGKSTVTDLTELLIISAGLNGQKGGNIGLPALDFLPMQEADIYVLELSSFQLDTTHSLKAKVSVLLNVSEDHMDRYASFENYTSSKQRIYRGAEYKVFNAEDELTYPPSISTKDYAFSANKPIKMVSQKTSYLAPRGESFDLIVNDKNTTSTDSLQMTGRHNWLNGLTCLSILKCLELPINDKVLQCLTNYHGLAHRFQRVSRKFECDWINDSKATNVGATVAAINSIHLHKNKLILIAGGDSKKSDLSPLVEVFENKIHSLVLLGQDAQLLSNLTNKVASYFVHNMEQAVTKAKQLTSEGDVVLLSPACSSLDMYQNFEARGEAFVDAIRKCA